MLKILNTYYFKTVQYKKRENENWRPKTSCCLIASLPISSVCDYLALRGFLGDSKLEVPLSGVESSSGTVSNSEPSLLIARALRGLFCKEEKTRNFAGDATYDISKERY